MASNYALRYTPAGGSETTHVLTIPIFELRPARRKRRFTKQAITKDHDFVFTVGSAVNELTAEVRFDDEPADLLDLLEAGGDARKVVLDQDITDGSTNTNFPSRVLSVENEARIQPESDDPRRYRVTLTLRHDGDGNYNNLID